MRLQNMSFKAAERYFAARDIAVIPVGSIENHGSHLCLGTDFIIPSHIAETLDRELDVLILPGIPYGVADHHFGFPGTISIGYEGLKLVVGKICDALYEDGIQRFVFLNGHGGNDQALMDVGMALEERGCISALCNWWQLAGQIKPEWAGGHAGEEETAAIMAIDPSLVHMEDYMPLRPRDLSDELPVSGMRTVRFGGADFIVPRHFKTLSESGWYGPDDPKDATREWGEEMLAAVTKLIVDFVAAFERAPLPRV